MLSCKGGEEDSMKLEEKKETEIDEKLRRQILDQIPSPVMAVNRNFEVIYLNESAAQFTNKSMKDMIGKKCYEVFDSLHCNSGDCCMKKAVENNKAFSDRTETKVGGQMIPVEYHAVPLKNDEGDIVGGLEYFIDITERVRYEERLKEQSNTIRQMSTPTIKLWEGVLVLPIVGVVDSMRAQHMMESMLNKIMETYSRVIIMDIHGVAAVDTAVANHLIKITKATKLMGCECIVSGISPAVAQTIMQLGINMESINTKATLSDALAEAFEILHIEVRKRTRD